MKKIIFGLIATVMFGFVGNAQKVTKEQARVEFATNMSELVTDLTPYYKRGLPYDGFIKILFNGGTGPVNPFPTEEGNNLLKKAHEYLSKGTTKQEIIRSYDGLEMARVVDLVKNTNIKDAGSQIFGGKFMKESKYATDLSKTAQWPPKWLTNVLNWIWDNHDEIITIICMFIKC